MPKSQKKDLSKIISSISRKMSSKKKSPRRVSPRRVSSQRISSQRISPRMMIRGPVSRPCGSKEKASNRYLRHELVSLARAYGIDEYQSMDNLCAALGISPHQEQVDIPMRSCGTKARGDDRFTREEVHALAKSRGIDVDGKRMDDLCAALGISSAFRPAHPEWSSAPMRGYAQPSLTFQAPLTHIREEIPRSSRLAEIERQLAPLQRIDVSSRSARLAEIERQLAPMQKMVMPSRSERLSEIERQLEPLKKIGAPPVLRRSSRIAEMRK